MITFVSLALTLVLTASCLVGCGCTNQNMDTFFKRILFAFLVCGSVIAVHLLYKKFTPIATQYISNNGCLTGCLGFLFYLGKLSLHSVCCNPADASGGGQLSE